MFDADTQFGHTAVNHSLVIAPKYYIYRTRLKRVFDIAFVVAMSPILMPLIALIAVFVMLDGGPAFFGHERIGRHGKAFKCWKLRTMVPDAEARLREYLLNNPEENLFWQENFKLAKDPRVTRLGKVLRKTSLDELPQFWNVLQGDMSVVGPRPVTAEETTIYGLAAPIIHSVRPGVTGLWQVSGRNDVSYGARIELDLSYIARLTFRADLSIILKTVTEILRRTGR